MKASLDKCSAFRYNIIAGRGMAQLVARLTGGQEAACSSHVTPTMRSIIKGSEKFF